MCSPNKLKVAIAHPGLFHGGSEGCVLWGITAVKDTCDVSLLTRFPVDLQQLNPYYGTSLHQDDFRVLMPNACIMRLIGWTGALRAALFSRFCRKMAGGFDVCIGGYNFTDFGRPAIQRIADLGFDEALRREYDATPPYGRGWRRCLGIARDAHRRLARAIAGTSGRDRAADLIVANSEWTADVLRNRRGLVIRRVLYPPVTSTAPDVPWSEREPGFVCLGRISYEKRIECIVEILRAVRSKGHGVHLHVIGPIGDDAYGRMVRRLCDDNRDWLIAEGSLAGAEKMMILAKHRYAIHACVREAFGIAVAEEVKAGCIPFVSAEGGPAEIVADRSLTYRTVEEAVEKIDAVLRSDAAQKSLSERLAQRAEAFATEAFMKGFRELVEQFAAESSKR